MSTKPPRIVTAALVLPVGMVDNEPPPSAPMHAKETKEVERRGVDLASVVTPVRLACKPLVSCQALY